MKVIAHRALLRGPSQELENNPAQIDLALSLGYDCEVDLWVVETVETGDVLAERQDPAQDREESAQPTPVSHKHRRRAEDQSQLFLLEGGGSEALKEEWWLGHDGPQYCVGVDFFAERRSRLIIHAKNSLALRHLIQLRRAELCGEDCAAGPSTLRSRFSQPEAAAGPGLAVPGWHFFFHESDKYTLTSEGIAWTYPGEELFAGCICAMPERAPDAQTGFWDCGAVCTDFAELYAVYDEMRSRHLRNLIAMVADNAGSAAPGDVPTGKGRNLIDMVPSELKEKCNSAGGLCIDPTLEDLADPRRCVAVYTLLDSFKASPIFAQLQQELLVAFPDQCPYMLPAVPAGGDSKAASPSLPVEKWGTLVPPALHGVLHFTILQILDFNQWSSDPSLFSATSPHRQRYLDIVVEELSPLLPFVIDYRGVIASSSGLMLLGYPSCDVNDARNRIAARLDEAGLPRRSYANNIVHSTLLRLCAVEDGGLASLAGRLVDFADRWKDLYIGRLNVSRLDVSTAGWKMTPAELVDSMLHMITTPQTDANRQALC